MKRRCAWLVVPALILSLTFGAQAALRLGSTGAAVRQLQTSLTALGYYHGRVDGDFGPGTQKAILAFQKAEGLTRDGVAGPATQKRLAARIGAPTASTTSTTSTYTVRSGDTVYSVASRYGVKSNDIVRLNGLTNANRLKIGQTLKIPQKLTARGGEAIRTGGRVEIVTWHEADRLFPRGARAYVIDVDSGASMWVHRIQGTYHADIEPVSRADTEALRRVFHGKFSWERHAVIVQLEGGNRLLAASINGYPHGREDIGNNGFPGHFCIHFYGSMTHGTRRVDPDHQAMILKAARAGEVLFPVTAAKTEEQQPSRSASGSAMGDIAAGSGEAGPIR